MANKQMVVVRQKTHSFITIQRICRFVSGLLFQGHTFMDEKQKVVACYSIS